MHWTFAAESLENWEDLPLIQYLRDPVTKRKLSDQKVFKRNYEDTITLLKEKLLKRREGFDFCPKGYDQ